MHVSVCVWGGGCMCQDQGRGGTSICQRSVSALGMNLISVIRFKSTTQTSSLSKVGFGSTDWASPVQKPGDKLGNAAWNNLPNVCRRLLLLLTFHLDPITTCSLAHKRIFLFSTSVHWGHRRLICLLICPVDYSSYGVQCNNSSNSNPFKKKKKLLKFCTHRQTL